MATKKKEKKTASYATHLTVPGGKRVYIRGKTKEEFEQKLFQARIELHAGVDITNDTTFRQYAEVWLKTYKGEIRPTTRTYYESNYRLHVLPYFDGMRLRDVRPSHVQVFVNGMAGLSKDLQLHCLQMVRGIFAAAVDDGLIVKSPVRRDLKIKAPATEEEKPLTDAQSRALLDATRGTQAYTFCLLALSTGMRRGELLGLMWRDVDLTKGVIHVRHNKAFPMGKEDAPVTELLKTEAARRDLPLGQRLREHLTELRAERTSDYVLHMRDGRSLTRTAFRAMWGAVERRTAGKGDTPRELGATYGKVKVSLDFDVHPHLLRHTFITQLFEAGLDVKQVQYLAGHSTPDMTMRVYTHYRASQRAAETHEQVCAALTYLDENVGQTQVKVG